MSSSQVLAANPRVGINFLMSGTVALEDTDSNNSP